MAEVAAGLFEIVPRVKARRRSRMMLSLVAAHAPMLIGFAVARVDEPRG